MDETQSPYIKWFAGGYTNAAFNCADRHVLEGHGHEIAFHQEDATWNPSGNGGLGAPATERSITRTEFCIAQSTAGLTLQNLGVKQGKTVVFAMPTTIEHVVWMEACKRLGVVYTAVAPGTTAQPIAEKIGALEADLVITDSSSMLKSARDSLNFRPLKDILACVVELRTHASVVAQIQRSLGNSTMVCAEDLASCMHLLDPSQQATIRGLFASPTGPRLLIIERGPVKLGSRELSATNEMRRAHSHIFGQTPVSQLSDLQVMKLLWNAGGAPLPVSAS